jgi:hypothetical protein
MCWLIYTADSNILRKRTACWPHDLIMITGGKFRLGLKPERCQKYYPLMGSDKRRALSLCSRHAWQALAPQPRFRGGTCRLRAADCAASTSRVLRLPLAYSPPEA